MRMSMSGRRVDERNAAGRKTSINEVHDIIDEVFFTKKWNLNLVKLWDIVPVVMANIDCQHDSLESPRRPTSKHTYKGVSRSGSLRWEDHPECGAGVVDWMRKRKPAEPQHSPLLASCQQTLLTPWRTASSNCEPKWSLPSLSFVTDKLSMATGNIQHGGMPPHHHRTVSAGVWKHP